VLLERIPDTSSVAGPEATEVLDRFWSQNDLQSHSGYIIARISIGLFLYVVRISVIV
jgi:hypothetical protein